MSYYSEESLELRERPISAHELLTWAEACTVETVAHPHPWTGWNFTQRFPEMPFAYRRSVIKDAIGKVRSYLSNRANWEASGKKKGKPGWPGATDHPTLYQGCIQLQLEALDLKAAFVRINVYTAEGWRWMHYPVTSSHYTLERLKETDWRKLCPALVLRAHSAELHIPQVKKIEARKVMERKQDPDLVTVAVDLNVKNLAVVTVRQHVRRMNEEAAHQVAARIVAICARYPGCVLLFERLRKIKQGSASKSKRMNRRQSNQLRGKINQYTKDKAYAQGTVTVEVNRL